MHNLINAKIEGKLIKVEMESLSNPFYLRPGTTDIKVFKQIFKHLEYNINFGLEPKIIIDCGANIGLATIFFKNKYPNATVISIEPEGSNFNLLLKNTEGYLNLHCLKNGIWNRATNLEIMNPQSGNWAFITQEVDYENKSTIKAISLDKILEDFGLTKIDILKIDIEGSEKELFEKNYEDWLPKTKVILIELHDHIRYGCAKSFFNALVNYRFSIEYKGENTVCFINPQQ